MTKLTKQVRKKETVKFILSTIINQSTRKHETQQMGQQFTQKRRASYSQTLTRSRFAFKSRETDLKSIGRSHRLISSTSYKRYSAWPAFRGLLCSNGQLTQSVNKGTHAWVIWSLAVGQKYGWMIDRTAITEIKWTWGTCYLCLIRSRNTT